MASSSHQSKSSRSQRPPSRQERPQGNIPAPEGRSLLVPGNDELLYGRHAVLESLLAGRRRIGRVYVAEGVQRSGIIDSIIVAARRGAIPVAELQRDVFDRAVPGNHQGVAAVAGSYPYADLDDLLIAPCDRLYLVLDHLQDVQNLGTLLRTAEAMAVTGVVLPGRRAAGITPAVVNVSSGAVEHLAIALVGNIVQALERMKEAGVWIAGLEEGASAAPLTDADLSGPLALVVGAEGAGLSRLVRERCDWLISIPMYGHVESLNAAIAGSIVLALARQRRGPPSSPLLSAQDL